MWLTTLPALTDATISPSTIGSVRSPDTVALTPWQYCRYVGRKVMQPSSANPTMKLRTALTLKTFRRNSRSGRIGSAARCSASDEATQEDHAPDSQAEDRRRAPAVLHATPARGEDQRRRNPSEMKTMPRVSKTGFPEVGTLGRSFTASGMITRAMGTLT